jgi:DNA-directed RNA polymerase specialized sigma24 family protein
MLPNDEIKTAPEVAPEESINDSSGDNSVQYAPDELAKLDPDVTKWSPDDWNKLRSKFRQIIFNKRLTEDDADEISNETAKEIWKDRDRIGDKNPYYWSLSVLENVIRTYNRKKRKAGEIEIDSDAESPHVLISSDSYDKRKEAEIERESAREECAEECLGKLPYEEWFMFCQYKSLRHNSGADREAIAEKLNKSLEALRTEVSRTLRKIRKCASECMKIKGFEIDCQNKSVTW